MNHNPLDKLSSLGLTLPEASTPGGNYTSVNIRDNQAFLAIQFPIENGVFRYQGHLGRELQTQDGYQAMQLCALNVLAQIHYKIGFDRLLGINHLDACYQAADGWDESPEVVNGASDLLVNVLGDAGQHSRAIFGVDQLPRNFCVGLTVSCTLKGDES